MLLDEANIPLTPLVLWNDRRAEGLPGLDESLRQLASLRQRTGVPALSAEFMVAKLRWFRAHEPAVVQKTRRFCLLSDYLTYWCTGLHVTEAGAAGLTGLLDIHTGDWIDEGCDAAGVDRSWLPTVVRAGTGLGPILPDVCRAWSLPVGCRFVVGCLDQYAGAIGAGNVTPDGISETTGTVLATVRCSREPSASGEHIFVGPACEPGNYYHMCFGGTSAALLEIFQSALPDRPPFTKLDEAAANVPPGSANPPLPWRADATTLQRLCAAWARQRPRGEAARAILEGVAYALRDQVTALCGTVWPAHIACVGGAAQSPLWRQIKADVLNVPTTPVDCAEPTSLGAALLALHGLSGEPMAELVRRCVRLGSSYTPDAARHACYRARFEDSV